MSFTLICALISCGALSHAVWASDAGLSGIYTLGPDDEIMITVFGEDNLSGPKRVGPNGMLSMPLIGEVQLEGLSVREAELLIEARLADGYFVQPSVSISVAQYRPFYIMGEVRTPGSYSYISHMTVLEAVALAGGFTYRANRRRVEIFKNGAQKSVPHDVQTRIAPGDVIVIDEKFF